MSDAAAVDVETTTEAGGGDHRHKGLPGSPPSPLELSQFEEFADLGGDYDGACYREYKSPRHYEGSRPGSAAGGRGAARRLRRRRPPSSTGVYFYR